MADPPRSNENAPSPLAESLPEFDSPKQRTPAPSRAAARPAQPQIAPANEEAQKYFREANLLRMRGQVGAAEQALRKAVELAPNDPEAFELLGDMQKQAGRTGDALTSFTRASELQRDAGRRAALEAKMARLVLERNRTAISQIGQSSLGQGNILAVVALSVVVPGLGQILAGRAVRGAIILAAWAISLIVIFVLSQTRVVIDGLSQEFRGGPPAPMNDALVVLLLLVTNVAIWIFAMVDAAVSARRAQEDRR
jgi:tetratricopeptide (TPR) repeat protein